MDTVRISTPKGTLTAKASSSGNAIDIVLEQVRGTGEHKLATVRFDESTGEFVTRIHSTPEDGESGAILGPESEIVYICSPYAGRTLDERQANIEAAKRYARFAVAQGYVPYVAHLAICGFLNDDVPNERKVGMQADKALLAKCSELWVFGDRISEGMASEIEMSRKLGIKIKCFTDECEFVGMGV